MYKLNENEPDKVTRYRQSLDDNALYTPSEEVTRYKTQLQEHENNKVQPWTGGTYQESLQQAMDKINNREKFSYDLNGDALYQQYKDKYMAQGRMAMQDTMGQAAALTGGYGNSYAATVGNQAYQGYLSQLNDVVPQLYQMALDRYEREGNDLYKQYNMYNDQYNNEYGRYRDTVSDWNTEAARLADMYYNEYNADYNMYNDAWNRSNQLYQLALAEQQALLGAGGSGGGGGGRSGSGGSTEAVPMPSSNFVKDAVSTYAGTQAEDWVRNALSPVSTPKSAADLTTTFLQQQAAAAAAKKATVPTVQANSPAALRAANLLKKK